MENSHEKFFENSEKLLSFWYSFCPEPGLSFDSRSQIPSKKLKDLFFCEKLLENCDENLPLAKECVRSLFLSPDLNWVRLKNLNWLLKKRNLEKYVFPKIQKKSSGSAEFRGNRAEGSTVKVRRKR